AFYTLNLGIKRGDQLYKTGFAMGIEPDGSGSYKSTTVFAADQFGIYSGSDPGNYQAAFFVVNGQVFMNSAFIQDGTITSAKIGAFIQSANYVAGTSGWRLGKDGNFELNGSGGNGRMLITNNIVQIWDSNNVLRVRMGLF
ncbi:phage tail tip fiber protein, partial [Cronobacter sakazakii]|uniref:phage tail tip fiber protein n=1 Tax=Cronobacter sakazakii TaxID=28141 RepID=UPI0011776A11